MKTMKQFVNENGITITSEHADRNPNMTEWKDANHYKCILRRGRKQMTTYFSQGYGIHEEPTAESVLDCLASDACGYDNAGGFEDWASEYGYDTDSRKAERVYRVVERQSKRLRRFMGDQYDQLLYDTERL